MKQNLITGNREKEKRMEEKKLHQRNKGGRPKKGVRQNQLLGMKCTLIEKKVIIHKAKEQGVSVSEYLRTAAMTGKMSFTKKPALPKEVLSFTGTLNHLAANLNQMAYGRNRGDDLNALQRAELFLLIDQIKGLAKDIKTYLR